MIHRILDQRLQHQSRHRRTQGIFIYFPMHLQPIFQAQGLYTQVQASQANLILYGVGFRIFFESCSKQLRQIFYSSLRSFRARNNQASDTVEGVEQEVRPDSGAQ